MAIIHANKATFDEMMAEKKTFLLDFFATWCGPCKMLGHVMETIDERNADEYTFVKVDIDQESELAEAYGVESVPTLFFIKDGEIVEKMVGFIPEERLLPKLEKIRENG